MLPFKNKKTLKSSSFILLFLLFFTTFTQNAKAFLPAGAYVGVKGGYIGDITSIASADLSILDSDKFSFFSASAGVRLLKLRAELEYIKRHNMQEIKFSNGSISNLSNTSIMANLYYDIISLPFVRIYIDGGMGYTEYDDVVSTSKEPTYALGAGATFTLANMISLDAGYRYFNIGKIKISDIKDDISSSDFYIGLRMGF